MARERLTAGLDYDRGPGASTVLAGGTPVLRLRRGEGRAHLDLVLLDGERFVEVSFQPAAGDRVLRERAARVAGADPNGWAGALASAVRADASAWGVPTGAGAGGDLVRVLGAVSHPSLAAAYAAGAATVGELPRWAAAALREPSLLRAAEHWFGRRAATRAVVRSLAPVLASLPRTWWRLASAAGGAPVLEPADVAAVLATPAADPVAAAVPTDDDVRVLRAGLSLVGRDRARRLLVEAGVDGDCAGLVAVLRLLLDVQRDVSWPVPGRRRELQRACLRAATLDPGPPPPRTPPPPPDLVEAPSPPARSRWATPLRAPAVRPGAADPPVGDEPFLHPPAARAFERAGVAGRYDVVLPRTPDELRAWARMLENCLGSFGPAVAAGASVVVGVREEGRLVAAAEVRDGRLVQLLGPRNRSPGATLAAAVSAHLTAVAGPPPLGRLRPA